MASDRSEAKGREGGGAMKSFEKYPHVGFALDPIHVGTGGARLGRADLSIVRDPVMRVPKIPGSSLAGVYRAYVAMTKENKYPDCAGLGHPREDGKGGHCGMPDCPVCVVFGFARDKRGGFAGLAAFSDAHVLLFPVATREGPLWITSPEQLRIAGLPEPKGVTEEVIYCVKKCVKKGEPLNLGWLLLSVKELENHEEYAHQLKNMGVQEYITQRFAVVTDRLFSHVVNSNLEVRTSVSINPETGAAEEGALFTYEALPRGTVLYWEITCKNPAHFRIGNELVGVEGIHGVYEIVKEAHPYLEALGIGGMSTRGMGRLRVLEQPENNKVNAVEQSVESGTEGGTDDGES